MVRSTAARRLSTKRASSSSPKSPKATSKSSTSKTKGPKSTSLKPAASKAPAKKKVSARTTASKVSTRKSSTRKTTTKPVAKAALKTTPASTTGRAQSSYAARIDDAQLKHIWKTYKRTKDINLRDVLIELHIPLVRVIAERLLQTLPKSIELDDLTSAGTFGLMDAIDGFDLSRGIKFKTYCTTRIRGSILDELRSQDWVPRLVRLKAHRLEKSLRALEGKLGRDPNAFEMAEAMEMSLAELNETVEESNAKAIFSLSEKWDDGDDDKEMEKVEILADKKGADPVQTIHQKDVLELITRNLTKKERLIIIMYYYEGLTMREIGEIMELTESRVCQIHSNVMGRLKAQLDRAHLQAS
ncbi:MAG: FliA/WhiG family RNA polymerase sigma factor [Planctomycetota bacterium]|jgi:RNA polymerase sigma factor for flagellar operon FliA